MLTYAITQQPTQGTISNFSSASGTYTYTPAANYNGTDSFNYTVSDGTTISAPATITVTVTAVNDAPVAGGDIVSTPTDTPITDTLPATDVDGQALTYTITQQPTNGSISDFNATTGAYTYTPNTTYTGPDSFTYTASDGAATSNVGTVNITVGNVANAAPVISIGDRRYTRFRYRRNDIHGAGHRHRRTAGQPHTDRHPAGRRHRHHLGDHDHHPGDRSPSPTPRRHWRAWMPAPRCPATWTPSRQRQ